MIFANLKNWIFSTTLISIIISLQSMMMSQAFVPSNNHHRANRRICGCGVNKNIIPAKTELHMALDLVTSLRTEWISAAICTNQIPREAASVLQLGTDDARAVTFVPRSVDEIITSSLESNGEISISCQRQLKQQRERRGTGAVVQYVDQRADDLTKTEDESVDVVISLTAAEKMKENGLDWKSSVREAARVLKPGGRFIFVEKTEIDGDKYLDVIASVATSRLVASENKDEEDDEEETYPTFQLVGYDDVDLVIVPHVAGVVMKTPNAGLTASEIEAKEAEAEKARLSELSISAFERGLKKRRKKKKKKGSNDNDNATE